MLDDGYALVVEDNPETQLWLVGCIGRAFVGMNTDTAGTVEQARARLESRNYELALIDLGLPDGNGLDLIRHIRARLPECHVVVATIYDDDKNLFAALRGGAKGYILKDQDQDKIVSYLQGIKQNRPALSAASSQRLIDHFNNKGAELERVQLTPREVEVTCLVAKGCNVEETAALLELSPDTVKGYVKNIYVKLGVNNRSEMTLQAIKMGLIESA